MNRFARRDSTVFRIQVSRILQPALRILSARDGRSIGALVDEMLREGLRARGIRPGKRLPDDPLGPQQVERAIKVLQAPEPTDDSWHV